MKKAYQHSVSLEIGRCKGCTHCIQHCPTQAIRVRNGHAVINPALCVDCGECIRICPYQAKKALFDRLEDIPAEKKHRIALPAPALYGQFDNLDDVDFLLQGLRDMGFDEVFEVARAAELVTAYTRRFLARKDVPRPVINSACPAVERLISLRFPSLCRNVMPILPPFEVAARLAKKEALAKHPGWRPEEICTVFVSPCPAKAGFVKNGINGGKLEVDYVVSMADVYFKLIGVMKADASPQASSQTGMIGMSWASTGGESAALLNERYLAADGIENVIRVLDQIETGHFPFLEFVELNACNAGCVGGVATVENPYIARVRLQQLRRYLPVSRTRLDDADGGGVPADMLFPEPLHGQAIRLDPDRWKAMEKMAAIEQILKTLPALDCGGCGAPTCRAFAEDVVGGEATAEDCVVLMREKWRKRRQ